MKTKNSLSVMLQEDYELVHPVGVLIDFQSVDHGKLFTKELRWKAVMALAN